LLQLRQKIENDGRTQFIKVSQSPNREAALFGRSA